MVDGGDSNVTRYRSLLGCAADSYVIIALAGLPKASFGASLGSTRIMSPVDDGRGKWEFVQAVPSLFSRQESEHWNIGQLSWRKIASDLPGRAYNAVLAMLSSSMAEVMREGFSDTLDWGNLVVDTEGTTLKDGGRPNAKAPIPVELLIVTIITNYPNKRSMDDVKRLY